MLPCILGERPATIRPWGFYFIFILDVYLPVGALWPTVLQCIMKLNSAFRKSRIRRPHVLAKIGLLEEENERKKRKYQTNKQIVVHLVK